MFKICLDKIYPNKQTCSAKLNKLITSPYGVMCINSLYTSNMGVEDMYYIQQLFTEVEVSIGKYPPLSPTLR